MILKNYILLKVLIGINIANSTIIALEVSKELLQERIIKGVLK